MRKQNYEKHILLVAEISQHMFLGIGRYRYTMKMKMHKKFHLTYILEARPHTRSDRFYKHKN